MRRAVTVLLSLALIGGSAGAATATVEGAPPSNDTVEGATVVADLPFTDTLDISTATSEPEDQVASCYGEASTTVWYRYTPTEDVVVDLSTAGSDFDTTLEVYSDPGTTIVDCDDQGNGDSTSRLRLTMAAGQTYFVRAAGYFSSTGTLVLSMSRFVPPEPPSNDTIEGATVVAALPFTDTVDISGATSGPEDEFGGCYNSASSTVWYRYTPAEDVVVDLSTVGSDFDTTLELFRAADMGVVGYDDEGGGSSTSSLRSSLTGGTSYLVRAAGYFSSTGNLVLSITRHVPLEVTVSVADTGRLTPGGRAVVDVTITCNRPADVDLTYDGRQALGPVATTGTAYRYVGCRDDVAEQVRINPASGAYLPGLFDLAWSGFACEQEVFFGECVELEGNRSVLLLPGR